MNHIQAVLFDLDGTVYIGDHLIEDAKEVIEEVRILEKRVAFFTNNSTKTRSEISEKLKRFGIEAELSDIYTSASVTVDFLVESQVTKVYGLGTESFKNELSSQGISVVADASADCVVIGMLEEVLQSELDIITEISERQGSTLIACNLDMSYPNGQESVASGCGQVVRIVEEAVSRKVDVVVGKPSAFMVEKFVKDTKISPKNMMIVGDSYISDIELAKQNGCLPVLIHPSVLNYEDCIVISHIAQLLNLFILPEVLKNLIQIENKKQLIENIIHPYKDMLNSSESLYIFGAQQLGGKILDQCESAGMKISGFIDNDLKKQGEVFKGKQIFSLDSCSLDSRIIIASTTYLGDIQQQLCQNGYTFNIPFTVLNLDQPESFGSETVFIDMHKDLAENKFKYVSLYLILEDKKSQETFCDILISRINFNFHELSYGEADHYFEDDIIQLGKQEVFVDGGGYSGDTTESFIQKTKGEYNKIHFFEPDDRLMKTAQCNLDSNTNIFYHSKGLFSSEGQVSFHQTGGLDGAIIPEGEHQIHITAIDLAIKEKVTFIKLDIEGAEKEALQGAEKQLIQNSPKLAVACYHKAKDLWELPKTVLNINPNYRIYFRHYSKSVLETVLYCVKA